MKTVLSLLFFFLVVNSRAGASEELHLWISSATDNHNIDWLKSKTDFENYTSDNYKHCTSVSAFLLQFRPKKPTKGELEYKLINSDKYEAFKLMGQESKVILKELEDFLLELIMTHKLYTSQNSFTYSWIYLRHLNTLPLNDTSPNAMTDELLKLQVFTQLEGDLFEKLSLLILSRKIFFENEYITSDILISQLPKNPIKYIKSKEKDNRKTEADDDSNRVGIFQEVEPQFIGGMANLSTFIQLNVSYPEEAKKKYQQGVVYVQFVVGIHGNIEDIGIAKGVSSSLDQEAFRVVSMMPEWLPGMQNNVNVKVNFTLPINFQIN